MQAVGPDTPLVCSKMGYKNLSAHFRNAWNYQTVQSKDTLGLGSRTLSFSETRDAVALAGQHVYSISRRIRSFFQRCFRAALCRFRKNTMMSRMRRHAPCEEIFRQHPAAVFDLIFLDQVGQMGLETNDLPGHGIIWRKQPEKIIEAYDRWSRQIPEKSAGGLRHHVVHSTEKWREAIVAGFIEAGVWPALFISVLRIEAISWRELMDARAIVVGSPTLNGLFPTAGAIF